MIKRTPNATHRVYMSSKNVACSKSDMLHRFITHLDLQNHDINRVRIFEDPIRAEVVFREKNTSPSTARKFPLWVTEKFKSDSAVFTIYLSIDDLSGVGQDFAIDYDFHEAVNTFARP